MFLGRDQIDGRRLRFTDKLLSSQQNTLRISNHLPSAKAKARGGSVAKKSAITVGSLVFIKHEGSKFNPRESYVVVKVEGDSALVQKINNGKFFSRQYRVPISKTFPCVASAKPEEKREKAVEPTISSSSSDDDIIVTFDDRNVNRSPPSVTSESEAGDISDSESSSDSDHVFVPTSNSVPSEGSTRRSSRSRRSPTRYGNPVNYNSAQSLPGENDVTQPWWPGYPRGSYSSEH